MTSVTYMMLSIVASYRLFSLPLGIQGDFGISMTSVTYFTAGVILFPLSLIIMTSGPDGAPICLRTVRSLFRLVISVSWLSLIVGSRYSGSLLFPLDSGSIW